MEQRLYRKIVKLGAKGFGQFYRVQGSLFTEVLTQLPPKLKVATANVPLEEVYQVVLHRRSGALIIANKGASLLTKGGFTQRPVITYHLGCAVYLPEHGLEMVDIGLIGNQRGDEVLVRAESACAPSFLFASQRCNCHDQWLLTQELASHLHPVNVPNLDRHKLEEWIMSHFTLDEDGIPYSKEDKKGVVLIHFGSQNGMGSGATAGQFTEDLTTTAWLRHRGEYSAEQIYHTSLANGFTALGLSPDPRSTGEKWGYQVIPIILDYLKVNQTMTLLTNNEQKVEAVTKAGYNVTMRPLVGRIDQANEGETIDRRDELDHNLPKQLVDLNWQSELKTLLSEC